MDMRIGIIDTCMHTFVGMYIDMFTDMCVDIRRRSRLRRSAECFCHLSRTHTHALLYAADLGTAGEVLGAHWDVSVSEGQLLVQGLQG